MTDTPTSAEKLAAAFHETYERLAPDFGYKTREDSAKPWAEVPEQNKRLMIAVCAEILAKLPGREEIKLMIVKYANLKDGDFLGSAEEFRNRQNKAHAVMDELLTLYSLQVAKGMK